MFKQNKYTKIYYDIVERSINRNIDVYVERHHIIPRCLGGSDDKKNIAILTAREHFICHWLLTKMHDSEKLKYAFIMMAKCYTDKHVRDYRITSKVYEISSRYNAMLCSKRFRGMKRWTKGSSRYHDPVTGQLYSLLPDDPRIINLVKGLPQKMLKKMTNYGKGVYAHKTEPTLIVKRFSSEEEIPEGWTKGNPNAATNASKDTILCHDGNGNQKRFSKDSIPDGWFIGSKLKWYNDGVNNKMFSLTDVPDGYVAGKLGKHSTNKHYHDPITGENFRIKDGDVVREGLVRGHSPETKRKLSKGYIGDMYYDPYSENQRRYKDVSDVPENWIRGVNPRVSAKNPGRAGKSKKDVL